MRTDDDLWACGYAPFAYWPQTQTFAYRCGPREVHELPPDTVLAFAIHGHPHNVSRIVDVRAAAARLYERD